MVVLALRCRYVCLGRENFGLQGEEPVKSSDRSICLLGSRAEFFPRCCRPAPAGRKCPSVVVFVVISFLGPFQHQILQYLKDMFDVDIVRYGTVQLLAEDILQLSRRRSEILLGYLGVEAAPDINGTMPSDIVPLEEFN